MSRIFLLLIALSISGVLSFGSRYTEVSSFLASYDNCFSTHENFALGTSIVIGWTIEGDTLSMGIAGTTEGWLAMGFSGENNTGMVQTDAVIGYIPGDSGNPVIEDYYISTQRTGCTGMNIGVCTDVRRGGVDNIQNISGSQINGVTILQFERPLISADTANDADILNQTWEYFTAYHSTEEGEPTAQHTTRSNQLFFNFFTTPSCPLGAGALECSGPSQGSCRGGCCVCEAGFDGPACDQNGDTTGPPGGGGSNEPLPAVIDPDFFDFSADLSPDFRIFWRLEDDNTVLALAMECTGTGWCSFGPSLNDLMTDSDVVYGYVEADGTAVVNDHYITARSVNCPGVCFDNELEGGTFDLLEVIASEVDGNTQVSFRRRLDTGDTVGDIVIENRQMDAVFAFNPTLDGFGRHATAPSTAANRVRINFFTGDVTLTDDFRLVHGVLMFLAWAVIIPMTSCVARYLKKYKWWFPTHWGCNVFAMFIVIAAFILIIINTTVHFTRAHHVLGLIIVFLMFVQVGFGTCADLFYNPERKHTPIFPDKAHWMLGFFLLVLSLINILLGLLEYEAETYLSALYIVWASCTLIIMVLMAYAFAIYNHGKKSEEEISFKNDLQEDLHDDL